jgi:hypothetical protein
MCAAAIVALVPSFETPAQAQLSFIGPGSTIGGDTLRGEGIFLAGAGMFNRDTAIAESIHVDSWIRFNQYWAVSQEEQRKRFHALLQRRKENVNLTLSEIQKRLRENPTESDLMTGDALNALLQDLTAPKISPSTLMHTRIPLSVQLVQRVPLQYPTLGGTISLRALTVTEGWPLALRGDEFALERKGYLREVDHVLEQITQGKLMPEAVKSLKQAIDWLQTKVDATIPQSDLKSYLQAKNFIKELSECARMLQSQVVEKVIARLERYPGTTVAELLEFMVENNLQFAPASELGGEREVYRQLYPLLQKQKLLLDGSSDMEMAIDPAKAAEKKPAQEPEVKVAPSENRLDREAADAPLPSIRRP